MTRIRSIGERYCGDCKYLKHGTECTKNGFCERDKQDFIAIIIFVIIILILAYFLK